MPENDSWFGPTEEMVKVLAEVDADRDGEGDFMIFGEHPVTGIGPGLAGMR